MTTILARRPSTTPRAAVATPAPRPAGRPRANVGPELSRDELITAAKRDLVDSSWVGAHVGIARKSVSIYIQRGAIPEPDFRICGGPVWHRATIEAWEKDRPKRSDKGVK